MLEFSRMSSSTLETFPNPRPERDYEIAISCPEFTSVCPKTGLPDFGEIRITYVPDARCVELKSLKYYLIEFRNRGIFYEHVTNQILDDLVAASQPRRMTVVGDFSVRGGIKTVVTATYEKREMRIRSPELHPVEPVRVPIERELDLHAFAPRDIPSVVEEYVDGRGGGRIPRSAARPRPRPRRAARHRPGRARSPSAGRGVLGRSRRPPGRDHRPVK